jgi:hypothetical protein
MSKMLKTAAVAMVLAMVAFGPTAAIAATNHNPYASVASGTHFGFIDVLMQILGIGSKAPVKTVAPGSGTTVTPGSGGATYSTDEAIWGGGGHCGLRGC